MSTSPSCVLALILAAREGKHSTSLELLLLSSALSDRVMTQALELSHRLLVKHSAAVEVVVCVYSPSHQEGETEEEVCCMITDDGYRVEYEEEEAMGDMSGPDEVEMLEMFVFCLLLMYILLL